MGDAMNNHCAYCGNATAHEFCAACAASDAHGVGA